MVPDVDELTRIADLIEPARFKALILNSAWCCLRYDEVTELRPKDIGEGAEVIGGFDYSGWNWRAHHSSIVRRVRIEAWHAADGSSLAGRSAAPTPNGHRAPGARWEPPPDVVQRAA